MDCHQIQQNELHEQYLLGRLSKTEKSEYEKHLEGCGACREELAKQKTVIAGIQAVGRKEMKLRIRDQVDELREQPGTIGSKWQMILKIAAVIFIIALIPSALYYFRTDSGEPMARLIKPRSMPALEQPSAADKDAGKESLSKRSEEEPSTALTGGTIDTETTDSDLHLAEALSEHAHPEITAAPKLPPAKVASSGSGGGYGAARMDANKQKTIPTPTEYGEAPATQEESIAAIPKPSENELLSRLSYAARYKYAESENVIGESVRLETKETTARKYDALNSLQDLRNKQKGVKAEMPVTSTAVFKSGQKLITINFVPPRREVIVNGKINLPLSFDIDILKRDSMDWKMNWYLDKSSIPSDPAQMEIAIEGQALYIIVPKNNIYKIDANDDTTKAFLLQE